MVISQNLVLYSLINPQSANGADFTAVTFDKQSGTVTHEWLCVAFQYGASTAAMTALKLQESTNGSSWTDISGGDVSIAGTLPSATDDNKIWKWDCYLGTKKRYIRLLATAGAAATLGSAIGILSASTQSPNSASESGVALKMVC